MHDQSSASASSTVLVATRGFDPAVAAAQASRRRWPQIKWSTVAVTLALGVVVAGAALAYLVPAAQIWGGVRVDGVVRPVLRYDDPALPPLPPLPMTDDTTLLPLGPQTAREVNAAIPFNRTALSLARPFAEHRSTLSAERATDCLAAAAWYEAGDNLGWQRAVVQTVLNRARHPVFPATVCGVVFQGAERRTGCQFTFTCDGALVRRPSATAWARARTVAAAGLWGAIDGAVGTATHYHTDAVLPRWQSSLFKIAQVGPHIFYRWPGYWGLPRAFRQPVTVEEPRIPILAALSAAHSDNAGAAAASGAIDALALSPEQAKSARAANGSNSLDHIPTASGVTAAAAAMPGYQGMSHGGAITTGTDAARTIFRVLDPNAFPGSYATSSVAMCKGRAVCRVLGWRDPRAAVMALPLSSTALDALSFVYVYDLRRSREEAFWNCTQVARTVPEQCLPRERKAVIRLLSEE